VQFGINKIQRGRFDPTGFIGQLSIFPGNGSKHGKLKEALHEALLSPLSYLDPTLIMLRK
jgi:hypothetical protein